MLKVINVITDTNIGGAGKCILNFLNGYDRSKIALEIFIPFNSKLKPEIEKLKGKYTEVAGLNEASFNLKSISILHKLFKQRKPDIVHTHAALSARIAAKMYGSCKIIHTRHSVFDQPEKHKVFPQKQVRGFINNALSDKIIAVSPAAVDNLVETGTNKEKIVVIYNGVTGGMVLSDDERRAVRAKYNIADDIFLVSIIARLEAVKGHSYVLDAAKLLKSHNIKILIAGTGTEEDALKRRAELEKIDNVIFTGFINDINSIENIMDLQINASYGTEATSLSLLEGMSLGKPAVVSDFGGNPFIISESTNGLVVPKKNAEALAEGILKLMEEPMLYKRFSDGAFNEFNTKYTSAVMVRNITGLYFSIKQ